MGMGERVNKIADGFVSVGKAMPLVCGGLAGFFSSSDWGVSPVGQAKNGQFSDAFKVLSRNYTGMDISTGQVDLGKANGIKGLFVGLLVREGISLLLG